MKLKRELSIVIPTLNEALNLRKLIASIAVQKEVELEVIIADGGSADKTLTAGENSGFSTVILRGDSGRATQLNAGAAAARGKFLLFLHADSELNNTLALRSALDALRSASSENNGKPYAGHFSIRFETEPGSSSRAYRLLACKARLNRKGCSHGDQGILIPAELFRQYGGFDESCQILAETRFADRLRENEQWLLLPVEITTSTRRFEVEGLKERQTLNAIIMALGAVGREDMIDFSAAYPASSCSSKLDLQPFFRDIEQKINSLEEIERREFWEKIGGYICENAWQIPFWADQLVQSKDAAAGHEEQYRFLKLYDRSLKQLTNNKFALRLTAYASRLWLKFMTKG